MKRMDYNGFETGNGTGMNGATIEFAPVNGSTCLTDESAYSLAGIAGVLKRRWLVAALVFIAVTAAVAVCLLRLPSMYEAELKLFITRARMENPVTIDRGAPMAPTHTEISDAEVTSEIELLKSRDLLEKVAVLAGLAPAGDSASDKQRRALAVQQLNIDMKAAPIKKTSLIGVNFSALDPNQAARVLNTTADLYLEKHLEVHRKRGATEFFAKQAREYKIELASAQRALDQFERQYQAGLLDRQKEVLVQRHQELQSSLQEVESQIREAENRAGVLRGQLKALPATLNTQNRSARNEALLDKLKTTLLQLEHRRTELLTRYEPGYRLVQELDAEIRDTRAAIERESDPKLVDTIHALNPVRQTIESELMRTESTIAGLRARQSNMQSDFSQQQARQNGLTEITAGHDEMLRRVKIAEENYLLYQKKQEESRIADAMDRLKILNVSIVERATPPALPMKRHRGVFALLGVVAALFAALAAAFVAEQFDRPVRGPRDLKSASGLPVLDTRVKVEV